VVAAAVPQALQILLKLSACLFVDAASAAGNIEMKGSASRESHKIQQQLMGKNPQAGYDNFLFSKESLPLTGDKQQLFVLFPPQGLTELQISMRRKRVTGAKRGTA